MRDGTFGESSHILDLFKPLAGRVIVASANDFARRELAGFAEDTFAFHRRFVLSVALRVNVKAERNHVGCDGFLQSSATMHNQQVEVKRSFAPIDMHVHIVGNGLRGSGCWLKTDVFHRPLYWFMLRHIGVGVSLSAPEFDEAYATHLAKLVRESSLGAAVILAQDEVHDASGRKLEFGSFHVPNDYVLKLAREHEEFLPAVSIHPARADALDELERCLEGGAVMLKLLPNCHNVDCNDARYKKFWERMVAAKLPLLAHTGGEHTVPVFEKKFSDPEVLRLPLECGVTVIAAHSATKSGLTDPEYFHKFREMLPRYPNLYGDTSAFNVPIRGRHIRACLSEPVASQLIHGSDYPVPVFGHWAWMQRFTDWENFRRCERIGNVLEKDYQLKRAMGFPPEHFTRILPLLRQTPAVARLVYK